VVRERYSRLRFIGDKYSMLNEGCDVNCPLRKYLESVGAIPERNKRQLKQIAKTLKPAKARKSATIKG